MYFPSCLGRVVSRYSRLKLAFYFHVLNFRKCYPCMYIQVALSLKNYSRYFLAVSAYNLYTYVLEVWWIIWRYSLILYIYRYVSVCLYFHILQNVSLTTQILDYFLVIKLLASRFLVWQELNMTYMLDRLGSYYFCKCWTLHLSRLFIPFQIKFLI